MKAEPLWSDERLHKAAQDIASFGADFVFGQAEYKLRRMRDEYEAEQAAPQPPYGTGVAIPDDIAETISAALRGSRRRPLRSGDYVLNEWDYAHMHEVDAALAWLDELQRRPQPVAMPVDWSYGGAATVETRGGGVMGIRFEELSGQGRPPDGIHDVTMTLTLQRRPEQEAQQ